MVVAGDPLPSFGEWSICLLPFPFLLVHAITDDHLYRAGTMVTAPRFFRTQPSAGEIAPEAQAEFSGIAHMPGSRPFVSEATLP